MKARESSLTSESNCIINDSLNYADKFKLMIDTWRQFWEAQQKCLQIPNTGMVVTTDLVDDLNDIHPSYKWVIGERLAHIALVKNYNKKLEYSGPVFSKMKIKKNKIQLSFEHSETGLISGDGKPLTWFSIAGEDGNFIEAEALIKKDRLIVFSPEVKIRFMSFLAGMRSLSQTCSTRKDCRPNPFVQTVRNGSLKGL